MASFQIKNELASGFQSISGLVGVLNAAGKSSSSGGSTSNIADYVVSPSSKYTSIESALDDARSAHSTSIQTIYISPGTYNENLSVPDNIILMGPASFPPVVFVTGLITIGNFMIRFQNIGIYDLNCSPNISFPDISFTGCVFSHTISLPSTQAQTNTSVRFYNCIFKGTTSSISLACEFDNCKISTTSFTLSCPATNTAPMFVTFSKCLSITPINILSNVPVLNASFYTSIISVINTTGVVITLATDIITASIVLVECTFISGTESCITANYLISGTGSNNVFSTTNLDMLSPTIRYASHDNIINSLNITGDITAGTINANNSINSQFQISAVGNISTQAAITAVGNISSQGTITSTGNIGSQGSISATQSIVSGANVMNSFIVGAFLTVVLDTTLQTPTTFTIGGVTNFWLPFTQGPQRGPQVIVVNNSTGLFHNTGPSAYYNVSASIVYTYPTNVVSNGDFEFYLTAGLSQTAVPLNTTPVIGSTLVNQAFITKIGPSSSSWGGHETHTLNFTMYFPANYYFWLAGIARPVLGFLSSQMYLGDSLTQYQSTLIFAQIP